MFHTIFLNIRKFLTGFISLSLIIVAPQVMAASENAPILVESVSGAVTYKSGNTGSWKPLQTNDELTLPVELQSGKDGKALIYQGETRIELKPTTHLKLEQDSSRSPEASAGCSAPSCCSKIVTARSSTGRASASRPVSRCNRASS